VFRACLFFIFGTLTSWGVFVILFFQGKICYSWNDKNYVTTYNLYMVDKLKGGRNKVQLQVVELDNGEQLYKTIINGDLSGPSFGLRGDQLIGFGYINSRTPQKEVIASIKEDIIIVTCGKFQYRMARNRAQE
jgi:hypothetical protein